MLCEQLLAVTKSYKSSIYILRTFSDIRAASTCVKLRIFVTTLKNTRDMKLLNGYPPKNSKLMLINKQYSDDFHFYSVSTAKFYMKMKASKFR